MHMAYAVILATVIYIIIGFIWYSKPVFGEPWMNLSKMTKKDTQKSMGTAFIGMIVIALIQAYFLASLIIAFKGMSVRAGVQIGFFTWLGFIATTQLSGVLWCKKPVQLYFITAGCYLVTYLIMGGAISAMLMR